MTGRQAPRPHAGRYGGLRRPRSRAVGESAFVRAPQKVTDINTPLRVRDMTGESVRRDDTLLSGAR